MKEVSSRLALVFCKKDKQFAIVGTKYFTVSGWRSAYWDDISEILTTCENDCTKCSSAVYCAISCISDILQMDKCERCADHYVCCTIGF